MICIRTSLQKDSYFFRFPSNHNITQGGITLRLKDIKIDPKTMKLEIDIMEQKGSFAIVVCDGQARLTDLPTHGETKIITHQGKVKRVKFDEGEDF